MGTYDEANAPADLEKIKAEIDSHYGPRLESGDIQSYTVACQHRGSNWFEAQAVYVHERFGEITDYYTILMKGERIEYQNRGFDTVTPPPRPKWWQR